MDYKDFKIEDFVLDQRFRNWVLHPDTNSNRFWEKWIEGDPKKLEVLKEARLIVLQYPEIRFRISDERVNDLWKKIDNEIASSPEEKEVTEETISLNPETVIYGKNKGQRVKFRVRSLMKAAAVIIAVPSILLLIHFTKDLHTGPPKNEVVVKQNPWGQKSTIYLNDGSEVVLNSGSSIQYNKYFTNQKRTITLVGEAYFKVSEDPARPFTVIAGGTSSTALGTEFNIRAYPKEDLLVSLVSGSLLVNYQKDEEGIILDPGEGLLKDNKGHPVSKVPVDSRTLDWKSNILSFYDDDERSVIDKLEKWYGIAITVSNPNKKEWKYEGKFKNQSLTEVLMSLGFAMDFEYKINKDKVTITYK